VELDVCPLLMPSATARRPRGSELGKIVEDRVDEAYVLSWPGPLETFVPLHDTGGYDRIRTPLGAFRHKYDQIKGTAGRSPAHPREVRITFDLMVLHPHPDVALEFVHYGLEQRGLLEPAWVVPSDRARAVCTPRRCGHCDRVHWDFTANPSGTSRDRASRFQVALRELALARWTPPSDAVAAPALSPLPLESGPFFERHFDAAFLETAQGNEILAAPSPDLFGRDRIGVDKVTYRWASLAIKGATQLVAPSHNIEAQVPIATFHAHPRHYLLFQYYDRAAGKLHPWCWLVPSTRFAQLATRSGSHLQFSSTINPTTNRWTPFRVPTAEVAAAFRARVHAASR